MFVHMSTIWRDITSTRYGGGRYCLAVGGRFLVRSYSQAKGLEVSLSETPDPSCPAGPGGDSAVGVWMGEAWSVKCFERP